MSRTIQNLTMETSRRFYDVLRALNEQPTDSRPIGKRGEDAPTSAWYVERSRTQLHIRKMPRVVANQRERFENSDIFQKLSRETEVKYIGYRDRPLEERQLRFQTECREGKTSIAFTATGVNIEVTFPKVHETQTVPAENVDFYREKDKVFLRSPFIMNGVCVVFVGWLNTMTLEGVGCLVFDEDTAQIEDGIMRETLLKANIKLEEFEGKLPANKTSEVQNTHM